MNSPDCSILPNSDLDLVLSLDSVVKYEVKLLLTVLGELSSAMKVGMLVKGAVGIGGSGSPGEAC